MRVADMKCEHCGSGRAACVGRYDPGEGEMAAAACDECCGHGNEDGRCVRCTDDEPCAACEDGRPCDALVMLGVTSSPAVA
jgi:hypothetical protein